MAYCFLRRGKNVSLPNRRVDPFRYLTPASQAIVKTLSAMAPQDPVPWTPPPRPLTTVRVALVSTACLSLRTDPPFDTDGERLNPVMGDPSYRVILCGTSEADFVASHLHIETAYFQ